MRDDANLTDTPHNSSDGKDQNGRGGGKEERIVRNDDIYIYKY